MIYTDLHSLCIAMVQYVRRSDLHDPLVVAEFRRLYHVYFDALHNPPQFVIGVGAISYAQEMLVNAQLDNV
jgi:hypothetical protein